MKGRNLKLFFVFLLTISMIACQRSSKSQNIRHEPRHLHHAFLQDADLSGMDFERSDLTAAQFRNANLKKINLQKSILVKVNFQQTDLEEANLSKSDLTGSSFYEANLKNANLSGCIVTGALFTGANVQGADFRYAIGLTPTMAAYLKNRGALVD